MVRFVGSGKNKRKKENIVIYIKGNNVKSGHQIQIENEVIGGKKQEKRLEKKKKVGWRENHELNE